MSSMPTLTSALQPPWRALCAQPERPDCSPGACSGRIAHLSSCKSSSTRASQPSCSCFPTAC
eukprot:15466898-Alexandrium_andersonii.AAC.1